MKHLGELWERINAIFAGYPAWVSQSLVGLFSGLIFGFIFRIMGRMALMIMIAAIVVGFGLHYFGIVTFNTQPVLNFLGMDQWPSASEFVTNSFSWCETHIIACVAIILGFIVGWKLGS